MDLKFQLLLLIEAALACGAGLFLTTASIVIGYGLKIEQALFVIIFSLGFAFTFLQSVKIFKMWIKN